MTGYNVSIRSASKELTAREKIRFKDTTASASLDEVVQVGSPLIITPVNYAVLEIHNEKSDNKDYVKYVIEDSDGNLYTTGSESFFTTFYDINADMEGEEYQLEIYKRPSKNYSGKYFITCTIV